MQARGHKWSQPTVVALEKGERALRFSEAVDLVAILQLDRLEHLGSDASASAMTATLAAYSRAQAALIEAAKAYDAARLRFAEAAVPASMDGAFVDRAVDMASRTPEAVIVRARERRDLVEPEALYEAVENLRDAYVDD